MKILVSKVIEYIGYVAFFITYILYYLTKEKMGVQRDFIYRNKKWMEKYFESNWQYIFIIIIIITIFLIVYRLLKDKGNKKLEAFITILVGVSWILLLKLNFSFVGLPMLLVSLGLVYIGRVIREI